MLTEILRPFLTLPWLEVLKPAVVVPWLLGMVFGVFVGATPGLTATMAVALIVPISFYLEPNAGLALIIGVSFTAIFAGDIPATYLRIPGTPASAAATLDGNELAKQGRGGLALVIDLLCSSLGGLIGVAVLMLIASPLAHFALYFSDFEYFWLGVLGLSLSALVSRGSTVRGLIAAALGFLISTIGTDVSGVPRYTFGSFELLEGLNFIPVMIGLFGFAEVLRNVTGTQPMSAPAVRTRESAIAKTSIVEIWKHKWLVLRSALLGTGIGALPGAGADIAAWGAYGLAKVTSQDPEKLGTGAVEGVVAPTSANNAAVAGAWIPALMFGIPGDAVTAIVLGAIMMYNITPGPQLFLDEGTQVGAIFLIALVTQLLLLPAGLLGIIAFDWILRLPRRLVLTGVIVFSVVGSFAIRNSLFDIYVMFAFGLIGYFLEAKKVPLAPVILGLILGELIERKLRAGLISSSGDLTPMFTRPICVALVALLVIALLVVPAVRWTRGRMQAA